MAAKRNTESTLDFLHDLRGRVIGQPGISTDGFLPYRLAIRDAFGDNASHGVIVKTYSVTNLAKDAVTRYSPAQVVAVSREVGAGLFGPPVAQFDFGSGLNLNYDARASESQR